jgi:uncharacterized protein
MRVLFDTSAIVKRYKREVGRGDVERLLGSADLVVLAAHCRTEVAATLSREMHDGAIDTLQLSSALQSVAQDFADFEVVGLGAQVEAFAISAMQLTRLRAMDALHIGTAQAQAVDLFITADVQQAHAARRVGLVTELIASV